MIWVGNIPKFVRSIVEKIGISKQSTRGLDNIDKEIEKNTKLILFFLENFKHINQQ